MKAQGSRLDVDVVTPPDQTEFSVPATLGRRLGEWGLGAVCGLESLLYLSPPSHVTAYRWFFVPFMALMSLHFFVRALDRRPRLTVDAEGITDRTALILGPVRIRWEEVLAVSSAWLTGSVELAVRDLGDIAKRGGRARRFWMSLRRLLGKKTISISPLLLGIKRQELESRLGTALDRFEHAQLVEAARKTGRVEDGRSAR